MKHTRFTILILALTLTIGLNSTLAQKKNKTPLYEAPVIPINETSKKVNYTEVITTDGSSIELYKKALRWFNIYYKNPTNVIREKSEEKKEILGKARFKFMNPPDKKGLETMQGILQYTIRIYAKEERFKYEITEFNIKATSYTPIELWMDKTSQSYTNKYDYYLIQLDEYAKKTVNSLNEFMTKQVGSKTNEW